MSPDPDRSPPDVARTRGGFPSRLRVESVEERHVWWLAVAALLADLALTQHGLSLGLTEANPFGAAALDAFGVAGLALLKTVALGVAAAGRQLVPDRFGAMPPAVLACVWGSAAAVNVVVILVAA